MGVSQTPKSENGFVWHFRIGSELASPLYENSVQEMIRTQLLNLLDVVILTQNGREVRVDGFKLMNDLHTIHPIYTAPHQPTVTEVPETQAQK